MIRHPDDDMLLSGSQRIELADDVALEAKMGATSEDVLAAMDFEVDNMLELLRDRHLETTTTLGQSWCFGLLQSYPYLAR